jgi:CO/xanthine dehydrogenase Mo-binding subunit
MQLANVRWADHDNYFRVVFDLATPEGEPVLQVPHAETMLTPDGRVLKITISGIRSIGSNANANATDLAVGGSLVTSIKRIPSMDDQALIYEINLQQPTTYALAGLGSPGRIVIDIMKP